VTAIVSPMPGWSGILGHWSIDSGESWFINSAVR